VTNNNKCTNAVNNKATIIETGKQTSSMTTVDTCRQCTPQCGCCRQDDVALVTKSATQAATAAHSALYLTL